MVQQGAAEQAKSPEAFRTISEVADDLDVPQHVLRFWESRFSQIKPVKRAGARRYYRPEDVDLIRGIRALLYTEGFTIKGAQKILRDKGVRHVAELGRGEAAPHAAKRASGGRPKKDETYRALRAVDFSEEPLPEEKETAAKIPAPKVKGDPQQSTLFSDSVETAPHTFTAELKPSEKHTLSPQKRAKLESLLAELQAMKAQLRAARNSGV